MTFSIAVSELVRERYSCRLYQPRPIAENLRRALAQYVDTCRTGPLGSRARFSLVAAGADDRDALRGLGTYGFVKEATAFVVGALEPGPNDLEDYGYLMESIILKATDLGLGTCWLGGSFTRSSFAEKIGKRGGESVPAVTALGYADEESKSRDWIRRRAGAESRLPWEELFFDGSFGKPLTREKAGAYAEPLEMVRLGPSASNRQPWRVVRGDDSWHFYLQRTRGYGKGTMMFRVLRVADLQRIDMGIAMCHFGLSARELGLAGRWLVREPSIAIEEGAEYTVSWCFN